ncbi:MAG: hypothetical protein P8Y52_05510 [Xanthomonadales bacterium]
MVTEPRPFASVARALTGLWLCAAAAATAAEPGDEAVDASWPHLRFSAASVTTGAVTVTGLALELRPDGGLAARFDRLADETGDVLLDAAELGGRLDELTGEADAVGARGRVTVWGLSGDWAVDAGAADTRLRLDLSDQPIGALAGLPGAPASLEWLQAGRFDATAVLDWPADGAVGWTAGVTVDDLAFDSPDGRFAGQGLAFEVRGQGTEAGLAGARVTARMLRGELLIDRLYRQFDETPVDVELHGAESAGASTIALRLRDPNAVALDATIDWSNAQAVQPDIIVSGLTLEFPGAYRRYLESIAAAWDLDGLAVTGRIAWQGAWRNGELESGDLEIRDLSVVDTRLDRFALTGLETRLIPGNRAFESRISWRGLLLGKFNLGGGAALLDAEPGLISLGEPLVLEVLGGHLRLDAFRYALPGARPVSGRDTFISASLRGIELEPLTRALGWPEFGGTLNGELPGARLEDGVLSVDGGIGIEVFGGAVSITDLRVERPFGVLPSLAANVELRHLDLERLTDTFSFGQIGGRVDGYVHDLRMLDWEPVAFDAWLGTPEEQSGTNDISRRAVKHLTSIGGGGATAALSGPMLRLFNNFSYRRLGLGCTLENYVCEIRGLDDDGSGVLLLEGAGVPRITIRAYNRSIDWPRMLANLAAISAGESIEVGSGSNP